MPKLSSASVTLLDGAVVLYLRSRTRKWQARFKVGGYWKRITTKCIDLDKAKDIALEQYMEHLFKQKHGIPSILFLYFLKAFWYSYLSMPFQRSRIVFRALCSVQSILKVRVMASFQSLCKIRSIVAVRCLFLICLFI